MDRGGGGGEAHRPLMLALLEFWTEIRIKILLTNVYNDFDVALIRYASIFLHSVKACLYNLPFVLELLCIYQKVFRYFCYVLCAVFNILGGFEVNFMDDVGQTLLNWASAFGTLEMVMLLLACL